MRSEPRAVLDAALRRSPLQLYCRRRAAHSLVVLGYHGIDHPEQFEGHLDRLTRRACPVSLDDVIAAVHDEAPLPPRSVLVTFDDGHRSVLEHGVPLLHRYGVPAVAFVVPGVVDSDRPHWWTEVEHLVRAGGHADGKAWENAAQCVRWMKGVPDSRRVAVLEELRATAGTPAPPQPQLRSDELRRLDASGVAVENHTWTHSLLDRCDDETVAIEIERAHEQLSVTLGRAPRAFAYPNGNWDPRAEQILQRYGYELGFLFDHRLSPLRPGNRMRISRVRVDSHTSLDRFVTITSGLHPALHAIRGRG